MLFSRPYGTDANPEYGPGVETPGYGRMSLTGREEELEFLRVGGTRSGPIGKNLLRRHDLLRRTGKAVFVFSGPAGDMNPDGFQAAVFHPQAELFVNFLDPMLLQAVAHAQASARAGRIAM